jgi:hypothetical protein
MEEYQHIGFSVLQEAIRQARYNALKTANAELVNVLADWGFCKQAVGTK